MTGSPGDMVRKPSAQTAEEPEANGNDQAEFTGANRKPPTAYDPPTSLTSSRPLPRGRHTVPHVSGSGVHRLTPLRIRKL